MHRLYLFCFNFLLINLLLLHSVKSQCDFGTPDGTYRAIWYFDQSTSLIKFLIQVNQRQRQSFWTGIGFGNQMKGGDMILLTVKDNRITISDRHGVDNKEPVEDKQQDIKNFNGRLIDGILTAEFSRAVDTSDKEDLPLMDREKSFCQDFMFPLSGGTLDLSDEQKPVMLKHFQIPVIRRMCNIDQCLSPELRTTPTEPPTTTTTTELPTTSTTERIVTPPTHRATVPLPAATQRPVIINTGVEPEFTRIIPAPTQRPVQSAQQLETFQVEPRPAPLPADPKLAPQPAEPRTQPSNHFPTMGMCSFSDGDYDIKWTYNATLRSVSFSIDAMLSFNKWTGIGFGRTMQPGDMILFYDGNGLVEVSDRHSNGRSEPQIDSRQDVDVISVNYNGDRVQAQVSRLVNTGDFEDIPLEDPSLNNCQYFMFPVSGGPLIPSTTGGRPQVGKHISTPKIKLICGISKCVPGAPETFVPIENNNAPQFVPPLPTDPPPQANAKPVDQQNRNFNQQQQISRNIDGQPAPNVRSGSDVSNTVSEQQFARIRTPSVPILQPNGGAVFQNNGATPLPQSNGPPPPLPPLPQNNGAPPPLPLNNGVPQLPQNNGGPPLFQNNGAPPLLPSLSQNNGQQNAVPQNLPGLLTPAELSPNLPQGGGSFSQSGGQSPGLSQNSGFVPPLPQNTEQRIGAPSGSSQQLAPSSANSGIIPAQQQQAPTPLPLTPILAPQQQRVPVPPLPNNPPVPKNGKRGPCPARDDHNACRVYIDDYFAIVFSEFPRIDLITQKACAILSEHQDGIVYSECCHYLSQVCGKLL